MADWLRLISWLLLTSQGVEKNYEDFYEFSKKECFGRLVMPSTDREDAISGEHAHNIFVIPELSFHFLKLENGSTK